MNPLCTSIEAELAGKDSQNYPSGSGRNQQKSNRFIPWIFYLTCLLIGSHHSLQAQVQYIGNIKTTPSIGPVCMPYTVSAGNDRILVAVYTGGGNDDVGSGTQFLDMSFTKEKQALSTCCIVTMKASVWVLRLGSGAAIADTLCLNINSSGGTDLRLHVFELHNVDQINTIGNTSIAGNLNASVLANGGDLVLGIMVQRSPGDNPTLSEASGQTEIFNLAGNSNQDQYAGHDTW
ncbi:MAG: hypothetical protein R2806_08315 [Saprospiraceae bacterium]